MREKIVWVWLFFIIASMGSYDSLATWIPKVLEMKEVNKPVAVLLPLGFFLAGPVTGFFSDRFRERKTTVAILGALATASILGINYSPTPVMLLCLFLSGFSIIGVLTITLTLPVEHKRLSQSAGSVVGLISSLGNIGPLLMPLTFGLLIDITGTFRVSLIFVAVVVGVTFIVGSRVNE
jgi:cyanate permease